MVAGCGLKLTKFLLILFNAIFWLAGLAVLGVGIWLKVDKRIVNYQELLKVDENDNYLDIIAYFFIGFGAFVVIIGFSGCCGALRESKCLLGLYSFLVFLVIAAQIGAGVLAVIFKNRVEDKIDERLNSTLIMDYGVKSTITVAWNYAQYYLGCCGYKSYTDYSGSAWSQSNSTLLVPYACCKLKPGVDFNGHVQKDEVSNLATCELEATPPKKTTYTNLNSEGCKPKLLDWVKDHAPILIGIGIGIGVFEIFGIICACCLCRNVGKDTD